MVRVRREAGETKRVRDDAAGYSLPQAVGAVNNLLSSHRPEPNRSRGDKFDKRTNNAAL